MKGLLLACFLSGATALAAESGRRIPVFPGAAGFGVETPAGRGGRIWRVTNLKASGEGSLREALEAPGPRTILFEVGGVIDLAGAHLAVTNPFLTLAGQSAPPPGITLIGGGLLIRTHDVLVQHIRIRPGDRGLPKRSGWSPDGVTLANASGTPGSHHVVIDHCSLTWAVDENLSASGQRHEGREGTSHDVTFSHCIVAEGLSDSTHEKGPHSKGTLIHDHARNVAVLGCLYASNVERNPVLKPDASAVVVNNLIYNPGKWAIHSYWTPNEYKGRKEGPQPCEMTVVGNVLWYGPDTPPGTPLVKLAADKGSLYLRGNRALDLTGKPAPEVGGKPALVQAPLAWPEGLTPLPVEQVADAVLRSAGAFPRDAVDGRIVEGVRARTGRILDSQRQVGGYPAPPPVTRPLVLPADPHGDSDRDGYTDLEEWLHRLPEQGNAIAGSERLSRGLGSLIE